MRAIALAIVLIVTFVIPACGFNAQAGEYDLPFKLYSKGDFSGAIEAAKLQNDGFTDYQLLFNSYMILYMQDPKESTRREAFKAAKKYRKSPSVDDVSDPGPMYVALKGDGLAKAWYVELHGRQRSDKCHASDEQSVQVRTTCAKMEYSERALNLLNDPDWKDLSLHDKLGRLLDAERVSASARTSDSGVTIPPKK